MRPALLPAVWLFLANLATGQTVDFARDIQPILLKNCASCHGPAKQRAGLRLDSARGALRGSDSGPILVPGKSDASKIVQAVRGDGNAPQMPPKGSRLSTVEIGLLKTWIDQSAKVPNGEVETLVEKSKHWAFQTPVRPDPPSVRQGDWCRTPIDRFILARLESRGLVPSAEADRVTLLRRVSLDLIGLPPTPAEADAFLNDGLPGAFERQVDRLLASPHYGERWGRHWLDAARYADSNGYNADRARSIWKYRDWVIAALNCDLPFDQFVIEQLAGDLLPQATLDQKIATGFHRNSMFNDEGGTDPEQSRVEGLVDRVNTTGTVFLGLTIACAQCHDHKYDPITQREYYEFYAFFNVAEDVTLDVGSPEEISRRDSVRARIEVMQKEMAAYSNKRITEMEARIADFESLMPEFLKRKLRSPIWIALTTPPKKRDKTQGKLIDSFFMKSDVALMQRQQGLAKLQKQVPKLVNTMILGESKKPRDTFIHVRGDFLRKGMKVSPGGPRSLPGLENKSGTLANRLDLARWIANPGNPLTARVMVNRIWQHYFGLGLVETENDFGLQGTPPSHPELLDLLATEFVERKWSLKAMHRAIVTSAVYRQTSHHRSDLAGADPRNRLLGRQNRLRLEAEAIRDSALSASGMLASTIGGPSVFPPQPGGLDAFARSPKGWKADAGRNRYRRGLYTHFWRSMPYPTLTVFDAGDATTACTRRPRSTTPLQALTLANDQAFVECAKTLAERILNEAATDDAARLTHGFRLCLVREPSAEEAALLSSALFRQRTSAEYAALKPNVREKAVWTLVARALLNLDEFITRE